MKGFMKRNPIFLRFWLAVWASEFGDSIRNTALTFVILEQFAAQAVSAISVNLILEYAPIFLLGPIIGVFADRFDRKKSLSFALLFRAFIMLLFIGAITFNSVLMIYIGSLLSAISTLVFRASQPAFTMTIVQNEDRLSAASYRQMSISFTNIIGPIVSIMLYGALGSSLMLVISSVLFIIASIAIFRISNQQQSEQPTSPTIKTLSFHTIWSDLKLGYQYAMKQPIVRLILLSNVAFGLVAGVYNVLQMFLITEYMGLPKESVSWFAPIIGVTMLLGSISIPKIKIQPERLLAISVFLLGFGIAGMTIIPNVIIVVASNIVFFTGIVAYNVTSAALVQTHVNIDYQGRVSMLIQLAWMGPMLLISLLVGQLYPAIPIHYLFIGAGSIVFLLGTLVAYRTIQLRAQSHNHVKEQEAVTFST